MHPPPHGTNRNVSSIIKDDTENVNSPADQKENRKDAK